MINGLLAVPAIILWLDVDDVASRIILSNLTLSCMYNQATYVVSGTPHYYLAVLFLFFSFHSQKMMAGTKDDCWMTVTTMMHYPQPLSRSRYPMTESVSPSAT